MLSRHDGAFLMAADASLPQAFVAACEETIPALRSLIATLKAAKPAASEHWSTLSTLTSLLFEAHALARAKAELQPDDLSFEALSITSLPPAPAESAVHATEAAGNIPARVADSGVAGSRGEAPKLGDHVYLKALDREIKKGVVTCVSSVDGADGDSELRYDVRTSDGVEFKAWPAKSVKLRETLGTAAAVPATADRERVAFRLGSRKPSKAAASAAGAARTASAPPCAPAPASVPMPTAAAAPPPSLALLPPRMPRLVVVVDTNELLPGSSDGGGPPCRLDRAYLLQECLGVEICIPSQVVLELDGLKGSENARLAGCARRANALLREAASAAEGWLLLEGDADSNGHGADGGATAGAGASADGGGTDGDGRALTADEKIVRCASRLARARAALHAADRVIVATCDNNLAVRAASVGVEARPLAEVRVQAQQRTDAWRAAYRQQRASDALEGASWARQAQATIPSDPV